jgi:prepilin-type N-terminal cleavage/methylation domain-containing protein
MSKKKAFTILEIIIVVVILGILAAIVIPEFIEAQKEATRLQKDVMRISGFIEYKPYVWLKVSSGCEKSLCKKHLVLRDFNPGIYVSACYFDPNSLSFDRTDDGKIPVKHRIGKFRDLEALEKAQKYWNENARSITGHTAKN